jgi:hypothetical protein
MVCIYFKKISIKTKKVLTKKYHYIFITRFINILIDSKKFLELIILLYSNWKKVKNKLFSY